MKPAAALGDFQFLGIFFCLFKNLTRQYWFFRKSSISDKYREGVTWAFESISCDLKKNCPSKTKR